MGLSRRKVIVIAAALTAVLVLVVVVGVVGWYHLFRQVPTYYASPEEHFKYGSIGAEEATGIPYYIWLVLPPYFRTNCRGRAVMLPWDSSGGLARKCPLGLLKRP